MNLRNLSTRTKLLGTLSILVVAMLLTNARGFSALQEANQQLSDLYELRTRPVADVGAIYGLQLESVQVVDAAMALQTAESLNDAKQVVNANREQIVQRLEEWTKRTTSEDLRRMQAEFRTHRAQLLQANDEILRALESGNLAAAREIRGSKVEPFLVPLKQVTAEALAYQLQRAAETRDEALASFKADRTSILAITFFAIATVLCVTLLLIRYIMNAMRSAMDVAQRIASGQLGNNITANSTDEFGMLLASLQKMDAKLLEIVSSMRVAADNVGSASSQISQGNDDLSQRTQEQAAALEETAASMEQMTSTVKQNADNARQANQLADGARAHADSGDQVVSQAVSAMQEINASSRKIADIIGVIDEIAFQTNLLALNAAVEAARAGEQGRGFAVVATEVRSLAQRSASAAKEIKELISDSVEKVKVGSELVDASGKVLDDIMQSVKKVSDIVAEISAASEEQSAGIEEVNNAVTQMDSTTQQNAALVEEAAAASKAMQLQAQNMVAQMSYFSNASSTLVARPTQPTGDERPRTRVVQPVTQPRKATKPAPARTASAAPVSQKVSGSDMQWQEF